MKFALDLGLYWIFFTIIILIISKNAITLEADILYKGEHDTDYVKIILGIPTGEFAIRLYNSVSTVEKGNILISPISLYTLLALTLLGANNRTAIELRNTLHLSHIPEAFIHRAFNQLHKIIVTNTNSDYDLNLSNRVFIQSGLNLKYNFIELIDHYYLDSLSEIDFQNPEKARNIINKWASKTTLNKITDAISPGAISYFSRIVLVNALYFKGKWDTLFNSRATVDRPFHINNNEAVMVPTMRKTGKYFVGYDDFLMVTILKLSYIGNDVSMFILLPENMETFEAKLIEISIFKSLLNSTLEKKVALELPKFEVSGHHDIKNALIRMGIKDLFSISSADLSGMAGKPGEIYISAVEQKTILEVSEEGSTAVAVSTAVAALRASTSAIPTVKINKPFLFLIHDNRMGIILFMGKIKTL